MSAVPPLPTTAAPPAGRGRIHDHFPAAAGGLPPGPDGASPDYRELELLVSGTANVCRYGPTTDEVIVAEPDQAYTTRIIVRRPVDATRFSGTAVLEIAHREPSWYQQLSTRDDRIPTDQGCPMSTFRCSALLPPGWPEAGMAPTAVPAPAARPGLRTLSLPAGPCP
jgi:hypothetical protein